MTNFIEKIISDGQTGVNRAALDIAIAFNIAHGGWCPKGRKAEDGVIANVYRLRETPTVDYSSRNAWNLRDSDGTLVVTAEGKPPMGGILLTMVKAEALGKPCAIFDVVNLEARSVDAVAVWVKSHNVRTLNVVGPRASQFPHIYSLAYTALKTLLIATSLVA